MSPKTRWIVLATTIALPYVTLGIVGLWWLYLTGWLLAWMLGSSIISIFGWGLMHYLSKPIHFEVKADSVQPVDLSPRALQAWAGVEGISRREGLAELPLDRLEPSLQLGIEVIESVAKVFNPRSKNPVLEIPVPHLLRIVELVAFDLRAACSVNIPGSHILTLNDLSKLKKLFKLAPSLYRLYRVVALIVNPATGLARELSVMGQERMLSASTAETKRWALEFVIKKTGYYAIELYSHRLVLRDVKFTGYTTQQSLASISSQKRREQAVSTEPMRILVVGQVKAGKSSLINALFGETRASVDVVPRTKGFDAYLLERDGLTRAIVLDSVGYEDATQTTSALDRLSDEILQCDLMILVTSATTAARASDRRLLEEVRVRFERCPDRELPPLVVALTHIDQLRPYREWNPPYNLVNPQGKKSMQIRQTMEAISDDLQVDIEQVVPVCLLHGKHYNVEEGLFAAIVNSLGPAERLKYLRCLREYHDETYWSQLWQQAAAAGRILAKTGYRRLRSS